MEVKRVTGTPYEIVPFVQDILDAWQKAGYIARPFEIERKSPTEVIAILSPFPKSPAKKMYFRASNNPQNYQIGRLFNPTGNKMMVVLGSGKEWYFGTSLQAKPLFEEL